MFISNFYSRINYRKIKLWKCRDIVIYYIIKYTILLAHQLDKTGVLNRYGASDRR